jgi:tetratricopeptide (TPR) repeat protein
MMLDFTYNKYRKLLDTIVQAGYKILTVSEYFKLVNQEDLGEKFVILRHDVDRNPKKSLEFAEIEHQRDIRATYYFRTTKQVLQPRIIKRISALGHEIGYHYETLDKAKGDYEKAIELFEQELKNLRSITPIQTICMHGNSWTKWDNRDIWKYYDFKNFDIFGEAYLSMDFSDIAYYTDTGRCWNAAKYSIKDYATGASTKNKPVIETTDELIGLIQSQTIPRLYIQTHANRWSNSFGEWVFKLGRDYMINLGKVVIKLLRRKSKASIRVG